MPFLVDKLPISQVCPPICRFPWISWRFPGFVHGFPVFWWTSSRFPGFVHENALFWWTPVPYTTLASPARGWRVRKYDAASEITHQRRNGQSYRKRYDAAIRVQISTRRHTIFAGHMHNQWCSYVHSKSWPCHKREQRYRHCNRYNLQTGIQRYQVSTSHKCYWAPSHKKDPK